MTGTNTLGIKPSPSQLNEGLWTDDEHKLFLQAREKYPNGPWRLVAEYIGTRSARQTMTHAQKFQQKMARRSRGLRTTKKSTRNIINSQEYNPCHFRVSICGTIPSTSYHNNISKMRSNIKKNYNDTQHSYDNLSETKNYASSQNEYVHFLDVTNAVFDNLMAENADCYSLDEFYTKNSTDIFNSLGEYRPYSAINCVPTPDGQEFTATF